ncbi:MAG: hypothetical protein ABF913_04770 [Oenococcus sp.]|uniref:hypothetical protein n=1 Tax=Oenococcus sp. TaxID=1979414 RepID=UPI0039ED3F53
MDNDFIEKLNDFINDKADLQGMHSTINSFSDVDNTVSVMDAASPSDPISVDMMGMERMLFNYSIDVKCDDQQKAYGVIGSIAGLLKDPAIDIKSANDSFFLEAIKVAKVGEPMINEHGIYLFSLPISAQLEIFLNLED